MTQYTAREPTLGTASYPRFLQQFVFKQHDFSVINEGKTLRILRVSSLSLFTQAQLQLLVDRWIRAEI